VAAKFALPNYGHLGSTGSPRDWVTKITATGSKKEKRRNLDILATFGGPSRRNRTTVFDDSKKSAQSIVARALEAVTMLSLSCNPNTK
jgi:hypothetical protein